MSDSNDRRLEAHQRGLNMRWSLAVSLSLGLPATGVAQAPKVFLNHVVVVSDSGTYAAINASPFLRDTLGRLAQYTIAAGGGATWTGSYLFGKNTYVELFAPGGVAGPAGIGMISYGVEERGSLSRIRSRLEAATKQPTDSMLRNRAREKEEVPWFYAVSVKDVLTKSALPTWVMEYHPQHNKLWDPSIPKERDGILRWQALASEYDPKRPLRDVVGVTVAVNDTDRRRLLAEAPAVGYRVEDGSRLIGPSVVIRLEPATGSRRGVTAIEFALVPGAVAPGTRAIGARSEITVTKSSTAVWHFQ
jgi:hypothetical protein